MSEQPAKPPHNRKLALSGIALTMARNPRGDVKALSSVRDELEQVLIQSCYLDQAPFSWVTISIRFGLKEEAIPHYLPIDRKYGDLPLAIEVPTEAMQGVSQVELEAIFRKAALRALIHAGEKYGRPTDELKALCRNP